MSTYALNNYYFKYILCYFITFVRIFRKKKKMKISKTVHISHIVSNLTHLDSICIQNIFKLYNITIHFYNRYVGI